MTPRGEITDLGATNKTPQKEAVNPHSLESSRRTFRKISPVPANALDSLSATDKISNLIVLKGPDVLA